MDIKNLLPVTEWLPKYNKIQLKGDLSAGVTVGIMLIPQGMAYAMLAGLPPIYGLYASIVPLLIYAMLGTSRQLAVGPVAMVALLIQAGVSTLAEVGSEQYISLAISLALMVGIIQTLMGIFKLGFLVNFLSHPVVSGFTSAAALIIGFSQLKHLLGFSIPKADYIHEILIYALTHITETNPATFAVGIAAIVLILAAKRFKSPIPGPLLAVLFGILVVWLGQLDQQQQVKIVGTVPSGLPALTLPVLSWEAIQALLPIALTISFIGFMESIAVAKAVQAKHKNYKVVPNQELLALGMANIGGAFFQSFPTTGGFSRTAVNDQNGAQTGMASVISALLIALTILFLTPLFYYLPQAILASVIMVAVFGLIDIHELRYLWKTDRADFLMLVATFFGTLFINIEEGILIGVVLSLGYLVYRTTLPHVAILGKIPGQTLYKNIHRFDELEVRKDVLIVRFDARLFFANVNYFKEFTEEWISKKGASLKAFILEADSINGIDSSAIHALHDLHRDLKSKGIEFYVSGLKGPVRDKLGKAGFIAELGEDHFFIRIQHAVDHFDNIHQGGDLKSYTLQTNNP
ncbi:MAG: solute carrier family 26 protein [Saprospiraceae bacterium]|jgi:sulfate permease, SulP family|nr:solute carrier family 26 protein [Saprospiraceae bacterium]MDP4821545.1 solute carrier family 26 protein [Saprospiraceae bacterium]MDP5000092.1 solute carrier family 26 protein [Saprospiraceae bacterium]